MGMGEAIDAGKPELALEQYGRAGYWTRAAMPTFEAAVAASRLGDTEQVFRYAAYAQEMALDPALQEPVRELMKTVPVDDGAESDRPLPDNAATPFVSLTGQVSGDAEEPAT